MTPTVRRTRRYPCSVLLGGAAAIDVGHRRTWGDPTAAAYCSRGRAYAIGYLQGVLDASGITRPRSPVEVLAASGGGV
jgi:hypothetical protein